MRFALILALAGSLLVGAACTGHHSTTEHTSSAQNGVWGSSLASLTISTSSERLVILASGGCYGSYADIGQRIPLGPFGLAGTYTQLIGAAPGKIQYDAYFTGTVSGDEMAITVSVPALRQAFGPYDLFLGVEDTWGPCLYPSTSP